MQDNILRKGWDIFKYLCLGERYRIKSKAKLIHLPDFDDHVDYTPTIRSETRLSLEKTFPNFALSTQDKHELGAKKAKLIESVMRGLITRKSEEVDFELSELHGFSASKSDSVTRPNWVNNYSLAEMGALIHDLKVCELEGDEAVAACLNHFELRLHDLNVYTDNWHNRIYWSNSGGSHHMSRLCYELKKQNRKLYYPARLTKFHLDTEQLKSIDGIASIYIINRVPGVKWTVIEGVNPYVIERLGVLKLNKSGDFLEPFWKKFQLIFLDHSKEYADIAHSLLEQMVQENKGMHFKTFLDQLVNQ